MIWGKGVVEVPPRHKLFSDNGHGRWGLQWPYDAEERKRIGGWGGGPSSYIVTV